MVIRVISFTLIAQLFIAIILSTMGVQQIAFDSGFLSYLREINALVSKYKIEIPNIPSIPLMSKQNLEWYETVLNFLIRFVNSLVGLINFVIIVVNLIIQVVSFLVTFVSSLFAWISNIRDSAVVTSPVLTVTG